MTHRVIVRSFGQRTMPEMEGANSVAVMFGDPGVITCSVLCAGASVGSFSRDSWPYAQCWLADRMGLARRTNCGAGPHSIDPGEGRPNRRAEPHRDPDRDWTGTGTTRTGTGTKRTGTPSGIGPGPGPHGPRPGRRDGTGIG